MTTLNITFAFSSDISASDIELLRMRGYRVSSFSREEKSPIIIKRGLSSNQLYKALHYALYMDVPLIYLDQLPALAPNDPSAIAILSVIPDLNPIIRTKLRWVDGHPVEAFITQREAQRLIAHATTRPRLVTSVLSAWKYLVSLLLKVEAKANVILGHSLKNPQTRKPLQGARRVAAVEYTPNDTITTTA